MSGLEEQIRAGQAYEDLYVPALFGHWPPHLIEAAGIRAGERVLDAACGTGVLARQVLPCVLPGGSVAGIDLDPGMLSVARQLTPDVEWRQGDVASLPYPDATFDTVLSQFGLMFFPDKVRALREMLRVMVPGGRLVVSVWDRLENSHPYPIEVQLLQRMAGTAAAEAVRAPFVLGDTPALTALFEAAGAQDVSVSTLLEKTRFPSVQVMLEADLRGWLPVMGVFLEEARIQCILSEAETALRDYVDEQGAVVFEAPAHIAVGRKP